jgi:Fe-coproporphyrin III synthase
MLQQMTGYSQINRVYLEIISSCNFRCLHCFQGDSLDTPNIFSLQQCEAILRKFKNEFNSKELVILGGEPFLHANLIEILKMANKIGYFPLEICTNGFKIADKLKNVMGLVSELRVSLDGLKPTHDKIRKDGSFEECIKTLETALSLGINSSVTTTVTSQNCHEIVEMCELLLEIGVSKMKLHQIHLDGNAAKNPFLELSQTQLNSLSSVFETCKNMGMTLLIDADLTNTGSKMFFSTQNNTALDRIEIQPDGRIYLSCKALGTLHNAFWYNKDLNEIEYRSTQSDEIQEPIHQVQYL